MVSGVLGVVLGLAVGFVDEGLGPSLILLPRARSVSAAQSGSMAGKGASCDLLAGNLVFRVLQFTLFSDVSQWPARV